MGVRRYFTPIFVQPAEAPAVHSIKDGAKLWNCYYFTINTAFSQQIFNMVLLIWMETYRMSFGNRSKRKGRSYMKKFENYISNLRVLEQADQEPLDNAFIISGIIDKFSIQFELGWKVLKKLLAYERSLLDLSFFDGELWLDMLNDRYSMAHIYNGNAAKKLVQRILDTYIPQFQKLEEEIIRSYGGVLENM